eukprot:2717922-Pyramimonas_sp.AAC.1
MSAKRCVACAQRKSLPVGQAEWDEQWKRNSADPNFRAQQQKLLDGIYADKCNVQRMKEQAGAQLRLSSEKSAANLREKEEALARAAAS